LAAVRRSLLRWYARYGRTSLPWRTVRTPYVTAVSEFMLVQTQVERVIPKVEAFVARFPDFATLARASTAEVVRAWKGLGYNARAVRLQRLAQIVTERYGGALPSDATELRSLPGLGPYGVAAIRSFAFNLDDAPVDTNVRRIVHRLFWGIEHGGSVSARELNERAHELVPRGRSHDWNSALMDLGTAICTSRAPKCPICPLRVQCVAAPIEPAALEAARKAQPRRAHRDAPPYPQSRRRARGRIVDRLRDLPPGRRISLLDLHRFIDLEVPGRTIDEVRELVGALERDGLVIRDGELVALRE
jgi:A/G-specific adenine glycosylase